MNRHPLSFTNLVDWVDGLLDEGAQRQVEAHLAAGCPTCQQDLAWLRRVVEAAQSDDTVEPPRELVAQAKSLYRSEALRPRAAAQRAPLFGLLRPAWAAALLLVLAVAVTALTQVPTLSRRHAVLTAKQGSVARRGAGDVEWQDLTPSERLGEGDQLRVLDGAAVLALFDGSTLHLEPGTLLTLSSLRSGLFGGSRRISVSQQAGSVDYEVAPLLGLISSFEAQAPSVRVTVRGTRFVLTVESEKETRVAVLQGSVRLVNALESTVLAEREVALVWPDAPPVRLPTLLPTATLGREATEAPTWTAVLAAPEPTATVEPYPVPQPTMTVGQPAATLLPSPAVTATVGATTTVTGAATPVPSVTVATEVLEFQAPIERFPPQWVGVWRIGGRNVLVTRDTNIVGQPAAGLLANVTAVMQGPSAAPEPLLRALRIEIESPPEWTPTPSSTVTLRPSRTPRPTHTERPTRTITPTRTPRETPGQEPTKTPKPTHTPRPTHTPKPSPTPRPTETLRPTLTPEPSHTPRATLTPKPSHTPRPTLTLKPSPTPRPTRTPTLTRTPRPTPTHRATDTPEAAETPQPTETPEPSETPTETLIEVGIPTATATP